MRFYNIKVIEKFTKRGTNEEAMIRSSEDPCSRIQKLCRGNLNIDEQAACIQKYDQRTSFFRHVKDVVNGLPNFHPYVLVVLDEVSA